MEKLREYAELQEKVRQCLQVAERRGFIVTEEIPIDEKLSALCNFLQSVESSQLSILEAIS
jgi:hypothetical protein